MKRIFIFLAILALVLCINVSFAENATDADIYVSNDGSDSLGDGSVDNPYLTLNYTIGKAGDNSNIYLKSGVYNSTGYEIANKSLTITGMGDVVIDCLDGKLSETIFKVRNGSTLILNDIKFINGYAGLETLYCIENDGELYVDNCCFNNCSTVNGLVKSNGNFHLNNVHTSDLEFLYDLIFKDIPEKDTESRDKVLENRHFGSFITSFGNIDIYNSNILSSIYNFNGRKMNIYNSNVSEFDLNNSTIDIINSLFGRIENFHSSLKINNSTLYIKTYNSTVIINNSVLYYIEFNLSDVELYSSIVETYSQGYFSNFTSLQSSFNSYHHFKDSNVDIHYCSFSHASFIDCTGNIDFNWWGSNRGPDRASENILKYWVVMTFENVTASDFKVGLNKYTDGISGFANLKDAFRLPSRLVKFETESGYFSRNNEYLVNGTLNTSLIDNNPDTIIYATIDSQVVRLFVGNGYSNYTFYVSDEKGNDYFYDGSLDYPYKTLSKAASMAVSGNTIYVLSGNYTLSWNANIKISKDITFIGVGDVTILRPNARVIFIVEDRGILTIKNINFTTATNDEYYDELIQMNGGSLNIMNCNFYNINTKSVIFTHKSDFINIDNVSFNHIRGQAILGASGNLSVNNSRFSNGTSNSIKMKYWGFGTQDPEKFFNGAWIRFYITVNANTTVVNTIFADNSIGAIYTNEITTEFHWVIYQFSFNTATFIYNTTFSNNKWLEDKQYSMGLSINSNRTVGILSQRSYLFLDSVLDHCYFYNNAGRIMVATTVNNSVFINNSAYDYTSDEYYMDLRSDNNNPFPLSIVKADLINNSYFDGNSDISGYQQENLINCPEIYHSTFINNRASYGGALFDPSEVHYCVFINNSAEYLGNDIFVYNGDLNASSNWWGSNQKPSDDRIYIYMGTLTLNDWVIMSLDYQNGEITASLDNILDENRNINKLNHVLPSRDVTFSSEEGVLDVYNSHLTDNHAVSKLLSDVSADFNVYATIDNQNLSLRVYNNSTKILAKNMTLYGNNNPFDISLVNINGHRISNQVLEVIVYKNETIYDTFTLSTDEKGDASFNFHYPVGNYRVRISYEGNGYFDNTEAISLVNVSYISTKLTSYNYTYYGKNNKFYAILQDKNGKYVLNQVLELKIFDSNSRLISINNVTTGVGGRADVLLSLDVGEYRLKWSCIGNQWYGSSFSESVIKINPINTVINLLNATFYGKDNDYEFTFRDGYGTLIRGETVTLTISKGNESKKFDLVTDDNGVASININLEPGIYNVEAKYVGDVAYGSSVASAILEIQPVRVTFDLNSDAFIPINGVFTAILVDMYGKAVAGENVTLDLYNYDLLKSFNAVSDGNGEANFRITLPEGSYFGILNYGGGTWYKPVSRALKITVNSNVILNNIYINGSDLIQYYGENKYFVIDFNDSNAYSLNGKIIGVTITSGDWIKSYNVESDAFGKARLQITLEPGVYNITYKYVNKYYDIHGEGSSSIFIYKMPTSLLASDLIMNYGEAQFYEVKLVNRNGEPLPNLAVDITFDGQSHEVITNQKGVAKILINPDLGYHNVTYSFGSDYYESSSGSSRILVVDGIQTATRLSAADAETRENELFNYSVTLTDLLDSPIISSEIILNITDLDGNFVGIYNGFTNKDGTANFKLNLTYGEYILHASYNGNDNYLASFNTNKLNVGALENVTETILFGMDCNIVNGENNTSYYVILSTIDGEYIKNQTVEFLVKGESYYSVTDSFGKAYLDAQFAPGSYKIISRFNGSDNLTKASITNYISVQGELCHLYSMDIVKSFNNDTQYYVLLVDANNLPLVGRMINFRIGNESYERLTDENGFACFDIVLSPGIYNITAIYQGNFTDEFASVSNNITVLTTIIDENKATYINSNPAITFLDNMNNPLSKTDVYFVVDALAYKIKTDENGIAKFNVILKVGNYNVMAINPLSGENKTFNLKIIATVSASNLVKYYKGSEKFKATFKDKNGNLLKNTNVKFTISGKTYTVKTNSKGVATLNINLKPGKYTITTLNTKTGEKKTNTVTVKKTILTNDKTVKANKKINFQAKILKNDGKIAKKVTITFKINKKTYKIKTNNKGIAILNIKLKKGKYTLSTTYNGLTVKNKITVK